MSADHSLVTIANLRQAFAATDSSTRLRAALAAGSNPVDDFIDVLVRQCEVEPDFFVREMLTWALINCDRQKVLERIEQELTSPIAQSRSQSLHTLSKLAAPETWGWITRELLLDTDDEVAKTAWRVAAMLVPADQAPELAELLSTQLARGDRSVRLSLSMALIALGEAAFAALARAAQSPVEDVAAHAQATIRLRENPEVGFDAALEHAARARSLHNAPIPPDELKNLVK